MDGRNLVNATSSASSISKRLLICETFASLCGESTRQGLPAFFIRLTGCNLRCAWCDTAYAWDGGEERTIAQLLAEVRAADLPLVVVSGGEPLAQPDSAILLKALADDGRTVLLETNGTLSIENVDVRVRRIVDVKPPSAGAEAPFLFENLRFLQPTDELKFVVADRADFDFAADFINGNRLADRCPLLLSPVAGRLNPVEAAEWILAAGLPLRLQLQLHKILWGNAVKGR